MAAAKMNPGQGPKDIHGGRDYREYTSYVGDVDVKGDGPNEEKARWVCFDSGGDLVVVTDAGNERTLTGARVGGKMIPLVFETIKASTTATWVAVMW